MSTPHGQPGDATPGESTGVEAGNNNHAKRHGGPEADPRDTDHPVGEEQAQHNVQNEPPG